MTMSEGQFVTVLVFTLTSQVVYLEASLLFMCCKWCLCDWWGGTAMYSFPQEGWQPASCLAGAINACACVCVCVNLFTQ